MVGQANSNNETESKLHKKRKYELRKILNIINKCPEIEPRMRLSPN